MPNSDDELLSATGTAATKRGRKSEWSKEQEALIDKELPAWVALVNTHDPEISIKDHPVLTEWKNRTALTLLASEEFRTLPEKYRTDVAAAKIAITRKYTNHRNSTMLAARKKSLSGTLTTQALHEAAKAITELKGTRDAKTYFKDHNEEAIAALTTKYVSQGTLRLTAFRKAWKELWDQADQAKWQEEASNEWSMQQNQEVFPRAFFNTLRGLCLSGNLGPVAITTVYAYRRSDNTVECGMLDAQANNDVQGFLRTEPDVCRSFQATFDKWATSTLTQYEGQGDLPKSSDPQPQPHDALSAQANAGTVDGLTPSTLQAVTEDLPSHLGDDCTTAVVSSTNSRDGSDIPSLQTQINPPTSPAAVKSTPQVSLDTNEGLALPTSPPMEDEVATGLDVDRPVSPSARSPSRSPTPLPEPPKEAADVVQEDSDSEQSERGRNGRRRGARNRKIPKEPQGAQKRRRRPATAATAATATAKQSSRKFSATQLDWHEFSTAKGESIVIKRVKCYNGYYRKFADGSSTWYDDEPV